MSKVYFNLQVFEKPKKKQKKTQIDISLKTPKSRQ